MKKNIILLFFICSFCFQGFSQKLFVGDLKTGQAVENVALSSKKPFAVAATDAKGETDITGFTGAERIEIRHLGYKTEYLSYAELSRLEFKLFIKPVGVSLDEVVVSATKWSQQANDIPGKVTVIHPKEISMQNPQTAADMLAASGKVFIQKKSARRWKSYDQRICHQPPVVFGGWYQDEYGHLQGGQPSKCYFAGSFCHRGSRGAVRAGFCNIRQ